MDVRDAFLQASSIAPRADGGSRSEQDRQTLAGDFDSFLTLLTAQLTNQDPLSPLDANQFTQQLVQFSSVEQAIAQNAKLDALVAASEQANAAAALDYLGKRAEVDGSAIALRGGEASAVSYALDGPAARVDLLIRNAEGETVRRLAGETGEGPRQLFWDGRTDDGSRAPDGAYRLVVSAFDAQGQRVGASASRSGVVEGVSMTEGEPVLRVAGVDAPLSAIRFLAAA